MNRTSIGSIAITGLLALCFASGAAAQSCMADLNGDRVVDGSDLANMLAQWGPCSPPESCSANIVLDAEVDGKDLAMVLASWGSCPVMVPAWATLLEEHPDPAVVHDSVLRESITATGYAWRVRDTATQIEMVLIPPGTFQMGCSPSFGYTCFLNESPLHQVSLTGPFYLGRYEVTQSQWTARMGSNPSYFTSASAQVTPAQVSARPVERVSWNSAHNFAGAIGMRLPTEAEWEYAYRATTATAFHGQPGYWDGTDEDGTLGSIAWFSANALDQTRPVGQKAGNGFGLHDMSGNVFEWVADWLGGYLPNEQINPTGPSSGAYRVVRGGSWDRDSGSCRSSYRGPSTPTFGFSNTGFRVARYP